MEKTAYTRKWITADILSFEKGTEHYEGLKAIRLNSEKYKLLIMSDYLPMIGELKGDMILVPAEGKEILYRNVSGFYRHSRNEFEFILKERFDGRETGGGDR